MFEILNITKNYIYINYSFLIKKIMLKIFFPSHSFLGSLTNNLDNKSFNLSSFMTSKTL